MAPCSFIAFTADVILLSISCLSKLTKKSGFFFWQNSLIFLQYACSLISLICSICWLLMLSMIFNSLASTGQIRRASRCTSRLIILAARRNPPSSLPSSLRRMNGQRKPPLAESRRVGGTTVPTRGSSPAICQIPPPTLQQPPPIAASTSSPHPTARAAIHDRIVIPLLPPALAARQALTRLAPLQPPSVAPRRPRPRPALRPSLHGVWNTSATVLKRNPPCPTTTAFPPN